MENQTKKKFNCTHCNYSTNYKYDLQRHSKAKHQEKEFSCEHCKFSTKYKRNMLRHTEIKHPPAKRKLIKSISYTQQKFENLPKQVKGDKEDSICLWIPMFYTKQKPIKKRKTNHEDKQ